MTQQRCSGKTEGGRVKREQKAHGLLFGSIKCDTTKSHTHPSPHFTASMAYQGVSSEN